MKPTLKKAITRTPDGGEMILYQHDRDFSITINGLELMNSRRHESELELARLGCAHLSGQQNSTILLGGLGLGYTLQQTLALTGPGAKVVVCELLDAIVEWNRTYLTELNGNLLEDERVEVVTGDIVDLLMRCQNRFDAILLDVDNGPAAMTDSGNSRLYEYQGIYACRRALRKHGCLAVWSASPSKEFEHAVMDCGLEIRRYRVPAFKGSKSQSHFIWVASENSHNLPPCGGEPRKSSHKKRLRQTAKRNRR